MIKQKVLVRKSTEVDEGTMGFHDYVVKKEEMEAFVEKVSAEANKLISAGNKIKSISYPNDSIAIIVYKEK